MRRKSLEAGEEKYLMKKIWNEKKALRDEELKLREKELELRGRELSLQEKRAQQAEDMNRVQMADLIELKEKICNS